MFSISLTVKRNSSVTYEYTGRMIDGTFINKGILHEKPNPDSFFGDGKDAGNVAKLTGHELQIEHKQLKTEKGIQKYPQWATESDGGKQTIYKTHNGCSLPIGQTISYTPSKETEVIFKLVQEISDEEEYISDDDEVKFVVTTPTASAKSPPAGGKGKGAGASTVDKKAAAEKAAAEKAAAEKAAAEKAAADKAAADKAAAEKAEADALLVKRLTAQVNEKRQVMKTKQAEVDELKKEIFKLRVNIAEATPMPHEDFKIIPSVVREMVPETTQTAFSAFRSFKKNETLLRQWEINANKLMKAEKPNYTNRQVMIFMGTFYKAWAEDNAEAAAKYEKQAADFNEQNKVAKATAACKNKKRKLEIAAGEGSSRRRKDNGGAYRGLNEPDEEEESDDNKEFSFDGVGEDSDRT
jgi:hypothetical protein